MAAREFDWERYGGTVSPRQYVRETSDWRTVLPQQMRDLGAEQWEIDEALALCADAEADASARESDAELA